VGNLARRITAAVEDMHGLTTVSHPASWLLNALGAGPTSSGVRVTPESAIRNAAVYRAVTLLSGLCGQIPLEVKQAHESGQGAKLATKHPNYRLLVHQPNDFQTSYQWRNAMMLSVTLRGNGYTAILWKSDGTIDQLRFIHPNWVQVYIDDDGHPVYRVRLHPVHGPWIWLSRFEMHHLWVDSMNGYIGISPIEANREGIGLAQGAEEYAARLMGNGAVPAGILQVPPATGPEARAAARLSWEEAHRGIGNAHKLAVIPNDIKFEQIAMSSVDAQWIELRKFQKEEISTIYGIPADLMDMSGGRSMGGVTGVEQRFLSFLATTLDKYLIAWEQSLDKDIFTPEEYDQYWPKFDRSALLQTDQQTLWRTLAIGRQWGWLTVNQVLAKLDMPGIGKPGDVLLDPTNMNRIPIDPTMGLEASGQNPQEAASVVAFLRNTLTDGRSAAGGTSHG
jgi:HK97 family phage portal protein